MTICDKVTDAREIGELIRVLRNNRGLTLAALAKRADVGMNTLSSLEHGSNVNLTTALRVLRALGAEITINGDFYPPSKKRRQR